MNDNSGAEQFNRNGWYNRAAIIDISAQDYSLEKCNITGAADVTDTEISFKIEDSSNKTIAEPVLKITN